MEAGGSWSVNFGKNDIVKVHACGWISSTTTTMQVNLFSTVPLVLQFTNIHHGSSRIETLKSSV